MKFSTLFVVGLLIGAGVIFGIRALAQSPGSLAGNGTHADPHAGHGPGTTTPKPASGASHEGHAPADATERVVVRLDADGQVTNVTMHMPDGASHPVAPGEHAPMGDYPARVETREGSFTAHLHPHGDASIEVKVRDEAGTVVAAGTITAVSARAPENKVCPVMGNPVDAEIYVDYEGRRIGFCCPGCDKLFLESPEKYLKKVDEELRSHGEDE